MKELTGVMETLDQQGDGLAIEVLEEECREVDIDAVRVRKEEAEVELKALGEQRDKAIRSADRSTGGLQSDRGRRRGGQGGGRLRRGTGRHAGCGRALCAGAGVGDAVALDGRPLSEGKAGALAEAGR